MDDEAQDETVDLRGDRALLLGNLVGAVRELRNDILELKTENAQEHTKIFARLEEGDRNMYVLKFSRCLLGQLDNYGILKAIALAAISAIIGFELA